MDELNYTIITGGKTADTNPLQSGLKIVVPLEIKDAKIQPIEIPQTEWKPDTEAVFIVMQQRHDGTFVFTYDAIACLSKAAQDFITNNPEFALSMFCVETEYNPQMKFRSGAVWPGQTERFCVTLQRKDANGYGDGGEDE